MKAMGKAATLVFLKKKGFKRKFIVPDFVVFSKKFCDRNFEAVNKKIKQKFKNQKIIIRSSSKNEDQFNSSNAGKYDSCVVDEVNRESIKEKLNLVKKKLKSSDEIIFQEYINKPDTAGVIFTRELNSNAPYYSINYDTSGKTDVITSGSQSESISNVIVARNFIKKSKYKKLLNVIQEIEKLFKNDRLDIEFCEKDRKIFILQCRPLKSVKNQFDDKLFFSALKNIEKKFKNFQISPRALLGNYTAFSNMSDWNPAEMIGAKPTLLSQSLYSELITDSIWAEHRRKYLYQDVRPNPLMVSFLGCTYIDLKVDINSFIPENLDTSIKKKSCKSSNKKTYKISSTTR